MWNQQEPETTGESGKKAKPAFQYVVLDPKECRGIGGSRGSILDRLSDEDPW
ncbi:MAG: hypothetical protein J4432_00650 [DPANN group archaeon]|nr:hypothetical protein [DPANN group archaeon]